MIKNIVFDLGRMIADMNRDKNFQDFIEIGVKDTYTRLDRYHQNYFCS